VKKAADEDAMEVDEKGGSEEEGDEGEDEEEEEKEEEEEPVVRRSPRVPKPLPSSQDTLMSPPAASVTPTEVRPGKRGRKPKNWVPPGKESPIEPAKATVIAITPKMMSSPAIVTTHNIFSISPSKPDPRMTLTRMNGTGQLPYASPYAASLPSKPVLTTSHFSADPHQVRISEIKEEILHPLKVQHALVR